MRPSPKNCTASPRPKPSSSRDRYRHGHGDGAITKILLPDAKLQVMASTTSRTCTCRRVRHSGPRSQAAAYCRSRRRAVLFGRPAATLPRHRRPGYACTTSPLTTANTSMTRSGGVLGLPVSINADKYAQQGEAHREALNWQSDLLDALGSRGKMTSCENGCGICRGRAPIGRCERPTRS